MDVFCKNCKHAAIDDYSEKLVCNHPLNFVEFFDQAKFLATGVKDSPRMVRRGATCETLRTDRGMAVNATICGIDGKWFEAKKKGEKIV